MNRYPITQSQLIATDGEDLIAFPRSQGWRALDDFAPGLTNTERKYLAQQPTLAFVALAIFNIKPALITSSWRWLEDHKLNTRLAIIEQWSSVHVDRRDVIFYPAQERRIKLANSFRRILFGGKVQEEKFGMKNE